MKNTFGQSISVTIFGESHGAEIGAVLDGLTPGIPVDEDFIRAQLSLRRPKNKLSTARQEQDPFRIVSGVFNGKTTGTPLCILIPNEQQHSKDYSATRFLPRPGHADYTAYCKYHGFEDYRGGGHFSGRITAAVVAAGAIAISMLREKGILLGTHIYRTNDVWDREFENLNEDLMQINSAEFPVLDENAAQKIQEIILAAAAEGDSVGGVLQTIVTGMPAGVGEPWFDSVESVLAHALFGIPAVKGVEFGWGFRFADHRGSEANDSFYVKDDKICTKTNHNGGVNGGITNGMPLLFQCVIKPTPSIFKPQDTVNMQEKTNQELQIKGRHDPAIFHRARVVVDSITALTLCDMLAMRYGTDWFREGKEN